MLPWPATGSGNYNIIDMGREETKSHGEKGCLVVILAPKLHVNPCGEPYSEPGVAYIVGQKNSPHAPSKGQHWRAMERDLRDHLVQAPT